MKNMQLIGLHLCVMSLQNKVIKISSSIDNKICIVKFVKRILSDFASVGVQNSYFLYREIDFCHVAKLSSQVTGYLENLIYILQGTTVIWWLI